MIWSCIFSFLLCMLTGPAVTMAAKGEKKTKAAKESPLTETWSKPNAAFDAGKWAICRDTIRPTGSIPKGIRSGLAVVLGLIPGPGCIQRGDRMGLRHLCRLRYQQAGRDLCRWQDEEDRSIQGRYDVQAGSVQEDLRKDGPAGKGESPPGHLRKQHDEDPERGRRQVQDHLAQRWSPGGRASGCDKFFALCLYGL